DKAVFIDAITHKKIRCGDLKRDTRKFAAGVQDHLGFKQELTYQLLDSGATVVIAHPDTISISVAIGASINAKIPESNIFVLGDHEVHGIQPYTTLLSIREAEP
ncbi:1553_t:CDS:2, partial [Racocetra fulgida]